jgi:hypothetical protein
MNTWIHQMLMTWLHVAVLFGLLLSVFATLVIIRNWFITIREQAEEKQLLHDRIQKYTQNQENNAR